MKIVSRAAVAKGGDHPLFVWGAISPMALPLGQAGLRSVPPNREETLLAAMRSAMSERAIYFFPGMDMSRQLTDEERKAWGSAPP